MRSIILATNNAGKVKEIQDLLQDLSVTIISQAELQIPSPEETGLTFVENAILKARHAAEIGGLPAIADDSGIEVDYLHQAPGIYSARYAGLDATDEDNIQKLLKSLKDVPYKNRTARFCCAAVFMRHAADPMPIIAQAAWEGFILEKVQGEGGFGYDPVFYVSEEKCTAAELPAVLKNQISHRGQAFRRLKEKLRGLLIS